MKKNIILISFVFLLIVSLVSAQEVSESTEGVESKTFDDYIDPCEGLTENQCKASVLLISIKTEIFDEEKGGMRDFYEDTTVILDENTLPEDLVKAKAQIERDFTYVIDILEDFKGNLEDAQARGLYGDSNQLFQDYNEIITLFNSKISFYQNLKNQIIAKTNGAELRDLRASAREEWMEVLLLEKYVLLRLQPARLGGGYSVDEVLTGDINYLSYHFNNYPLWVEFKSRAMNDQDIYDDTKSGFVQSWIDSDNEWSTLWLGDTAMEEVQV